MIPSTCAIAYTDHCTDVPPSDYPTAKYIQRHADIYNDRNITNFNKKPPKNRYTGC